MKEKEEHPMMGQDSLRKYMYNMFIKKEYSYLRSLTGQARLDRLPLPMCFELSVKQAFPNPEGRLYTGFHRTRASSKKNSISEQYKNLLSLTSIYIYSTV